MKILEKYLVVLCLTLITIAEIIVEGMNNSTSEAGALGVVLFILYGFYRLGKIIFVDETPENTSKNVADFTTWLQDNYSTNKKQGSSEPLPKGYWRKDFTDEIFKVEDIWLNYNEK